MSKETVKHAGKNSPNSEKGKPAFLGLRLPAGTKKKLEHQAADNGVSMTEWCSRVLSEAVGKSPSPNAAVVESALVREGVRDVCDEIERLERRFAQMRKYHCDAYYGGREEPHWTQFWAGQSKEEQASIAELVRSKRQIVELRSKLFPEQCPESGETS